jgi:hypothetical protein
MPKVGKSKASQQRANQALREQGPGDQMIAPASAVDGMLMQLNMHRNWYKHQMQNNPDIVQAQPTNNVPPKPIAALVGWAVRGSAQGRFK